MISELKNIKEIECTMNKELDLDLFMICLEVTGQSPDTNLVFWLDYLKKRIQGKIHIVSFRCIEQGLQEKYSNKNIVWVLEMGQSYNELEKYIDELNQEDAIIIIGGESLVHFSLEKSMSSLDFGDRKSNLYLQEDLDWIEFSQSINYLYGKYQSYINGFVLICNVNNAIANVINKELENSKNMSICKTEIVGYNNDSLDKASVVLRTIKDKTLQDALDIIDKEASTMSTEHNVMCQAIAFYNNGNITKSIELLNLIYKILTEEQKLFLAELYILQSSIEEAKNIFDEIYSINKQQKGLYELG